MNEWSGEGPGRGDAAEERSGEELGRGDAVEEQAGGQNGKGNVVNEQSGEAAVVPLDDLTITVVYDNRVYREGFEADWGFSCVIAGTGKTILFDTGAKGGILIRNMERAGIDPASIDIVFLSHDHWDHTGGLETFLDKNSNSQVYCLGAFSGKFKDAARKTCAGLVEADESERLCRGVRSTGKMGRGIAEHSLILDTDRGLIVFTGCAHPGIVEIVERAKELAGKDVLFAMGGFHLMEKSQSRLEGIIGEFHGLGVRHAAPCHCSGDGAIAAFEKDYGDRFIRVGAGRVITAADFE